VARCTEKYGSVFYKAFPPHLILSGTKSIRKTQPPIVVGKKAKIAILRDHERKAVRNTLTKAVRRQMSVPQMA
jgi:hypothetical protein